MGIITRKETGLFPAPAEIKLKCSCPDWATMCKHVAAVLYGVGARLDQSPELLFTLRSVNHEELITQAATATDLAGKTAAAGPELAESEIGAVFGIELDSSYRPRCAGGFGSRDAPAQIPEGGSLAARRGAQSPRSSAAATARAVLSRRVTFWGHISTFDKFESFTTDCHLEEAWA